MNDLANANLALLQSQFSTSIIEHINVWLNALDLDQNVVLWNATAERLSGYTRDEVLGHALIWDWLYPDPDYRAAIRSRVAAILARDGALQNFETRIVCKDGVQRTILWNSQSLLDDCGEPYCILTFGYEFTELERARKALQKAHNDLSVLYDVVSVATASIDLDTILNRALDRVLEAMDCPRGAVHVWNEESSTLQLAAYEGLPTSVISQLATISPRDDLIGRVLRLVEPVIVTDMAQKIDIFRAIPARMLHSYLGVPMRAKGSVLGVFSIMGRSGRDFSAEEVALLSSIADQVGIAVVNAHLYQQAKQLAVMEERRRLARDLHDSVTQTLYSLTLFAETGRRFVQRNELDAAEAYLNRLIETAQRALKEMRLLVFELRPLGLETDGLVTTIQKRLDAVERRAGVRAQLIADADLALPGHSERDLYHIIQEALSNSLKHAGATAVVVEIRRIDSQVFVRIQDNGIGFDVEEARRRGGLGLSSMQERAEKLGADLTISSEPGVATTVSLAVDLRHFPTCDESSMRSQDDAS